MPLMVLKKIHKAVLLEGHVTMFTNAYVLINVESERTPEVVERLRAIPGGIVREVKGPYDVVVELEADTEEDLAEILRHKINPIPGISDTVTCTWLVKDVSGLGEGRTGSE
jgi:DNA-binding Lrp family transcriptional regulator